MIGTYHHSLVSYDAFTPYNNFDYNDVNNYIITRDMNCSQAHPSFIEADQTLNDRLRELRNSDAMEGFFESLPNNMSYADFDCGVSVGSSMRENSGSSDDFNIFRIFQDIEIVSNPDLSTDETSNSNIEFENLLGQSCDPNDVLDRTCDPNDVLDRSCVVQDSFKECGIDLQEINKKIVSQVYDDHCYSKSTTWLPLPSLPSFIVSSMREITESPKSSPDDDDDTPEEKEDVKDLTWQPACSAPKKRRGRPPSNRQNKKSPKETNAKVKTPISAKKYAKHMKTEEERDIHNKKERGRRALITQNLAEIERRLPIEVMKLCFQAIQNVKSSGRDEPEDELSSKVLFEMRRLKESSYSQQPRGRACATPKKFSKMTVLLSSVYHIRYNKNVSISKKKEKFNKLTKEKRKCHKVRQEFRAQ